MKGTFILKKHLLLSRAIKIYLKKSPGSPAQVDALARVCTIKSKIILKEKNVHEIERIRKMNPICHLVNQRATSQCETICVNRLAECRGVDETLDIYQFAIQHKLTNCIKYARNNLEIACINASRLIKTEQERIALWAKAPAGSEAEAIISAIKFEEIS